MAPKPNDSRKQCDYFAEVLKLNALTKYRLLSSDNRIYLSIHFTLTNEE